MTAQELRIGNWALIENMVQQIIDVMCDSVNTHNFCGAHYGLIEPILLTEEWLLRFECERVGKKWRLIEGFHYIEFDLCSAYIGGIQIAIFEYVHQFQNLIFALTGEELTLKEL